MTVFVLDAGELIGLENNSRAAWARLRAARRGSDQLIVPTGVIGQVWRGTPQQARLNQALKASRKAIREACTWCLQGKYKQQT